MATLEQERHIELVSGTAEKFVIVSSMTDADIPDELPHLSIFVLKVINVLDAKDDTFMRVARISDLTEVPVGRDNADASTKEYLTPVVTLGYPTLTQALAAMTAMKDRVNKLIQDWISFATDFNAPDPSPALYTLPTVDPSQKNALIAAYKTAKQDRYQKELELEDAATAKLTAQNDYTYKQGLVSDFAEALNKAAAIDTEMTQAKAYLASLLSSSSTFLGDNPGGVGAVVFAAAIAAAAQQNVWMENYLGDAIAVASLTEEYNTDRQADVTDAATVLSAATTDHAAKDQAFTSAQALEATALAAVLVVCPDFDSTSIPLVDG